MTITKTFWEELSDKQKWDVFVALRGPDVSDSEGIKWLTTAVIRGVMSKVIRVGGTVNRDLNLVVVPSFWSSKPPSKGLTPEKDIKGAVLFSGNHFFTHIGEAAMHLGIPAVGVDAIKYREVVLGNDNPGSVCLKMVPLLRGDAQAELIRHLKDQWRITYNA